MKRYSDIRWNNIPVFLFLLLILTGGVSCSKTGGDRDISETEFRNPGRDYYPETWYHFIGGNVSKQGITADLEAIAKAGISGIQLFHGQF